MSDDLEELPYEVYIVRRSKAGDILYIGEGMRGRHSHTTSGVSHVYELNKLHFEGVDVHIEIYGYYKTKKEVKSIESNLIIELDPFYNRRLTVGRSEKQKVCSHFNKMIQDFLERTAQGEKVQAKMWHYILYCMYKTLYEDSFKMTNGMVKEFSRYLESINVKGLSHPSIHHLVRSMNSKGTGQVRTDCPFIDTYSRDEDRAGSITVYLKKGHPIEFNKKSERVRKNLRRKVSLPEANKHFSDFLSEERGLK